MSQDEIRQTASEIAKKLSSWPVFAAFVAVVAALMWINYEQEQNTTEAIKTIVYDQLTWDRRMLEMCFGGQE